MTNITGELKASTPNPDWVDEETTPNVSPYVSSPVDAFMWLIETDVEPPRVFVNRVEGGVIDIEVPSGQFRLNFENVVGELPDTPVITDNGGVPGRTFTVQVGVVYDDEGNIIDEGTTEQQWRPIRDAGGFGPVVRVPEPEPDTMTWSEARTTYVAPNVEENSNE